jgi:hypothetical protein
MGASGWSYVTPYSEDPTVWLGRLHREVLASGDYYWGDDEVPRPSTMEQLSALFEQDEDLACEGTHTILDIWQVAPPGVRPAGNDIFGTLISLNEDEVRLWPTGICGRRSPVLCVRAPSLSARRGGPRGPLRRPPVSPSGGG